MDKETNKAQGIVADKNQMDKQLKRLIPPIRELLKQETGIVPNSDHVFDSLIEYCFANDINGLQEVNLTESDLIEISHKVEQKHKAHLQELRERDSKNEDSSHRNYLAELAGDDFFEKKGKERGECMGMHNVIRNEIEAVDDPARKLKLYRKQKKQLIDDGLHHRVTNDFKEDTLAFLNVAIKELESEQVAAENSHSLIKAFSKYFSEDSDYSANAIETYLIEWYERRSFTYFRSKAKKVAKPKCDELEKVNDGTLMNWEKQCTEFLDSRTEK